MDKSDMLVKLSSDSKLNIYGSDNNSNTCTLFNNVYSNYDRSILSDVDPDINYFTNSVNSKYYNETTFNNTFCQKLNLSIFHLNIRSVPLHFSELVLYLDVLNIDFSIIALSETAINSTHVSYDIPNYNVEMNYREKKRGGGVSMYIHSILQYKTRNDLQLGGDVNSVFIEIFKVSVKTKHNVICGCVYRPPSMSLKTFNELLNSMLGKLQHEHKYVYITGDFNVNVLQDVEGSLDTQDFKNIFSSSFFCPLITKPTRVAENSATLIDNIYCNIPEVDTHCESGILKLSISDHYAIFCISKNTTMCSKNTVITKRSFCDKNVYNFNCCLKNESWDSVYSISGTQPAFTRFQGVIDRLLHKNFKMLTFTMNYKNRHPWMTEALRTQIKNKNTMYAKVLQTKNKELQDEYKKLKNSLQSSLKNTEIQYYSNQLEIHKNDSSKSWKILKNIIGKDSCKSSTNLSFCIDSTTITDGTEIANSFNNFFISIGPQLANSINCTVNPMSYVDSIEHSIVITDISCYEVKQVISSLKNSSAGWDELPTFVANKCVDGFIEPLTYLINSSIKEGVFPNELKLARVVPIFKAGDKTKLTNYRPISVLSFFSKVFERIMYNHLLDFIDKNHVIYQHQYGFRRKHSTQQAIITLVDRITNSLDKGDIVISVFLDLKKAFDTVDHPTLLNKLYAYGIRGSVFNWLKSYLNERSQFVVYGNSQSDTHIVTCGVPQGSILGPLLFIIYMNDICNVSNLLYTIMFADDTSVQVSGNDLNNLVSSLNVQLQFLSTWLKANKLSLNTKKTFFIVFHRARIKDHRISIQMDGSVLNRSTSIKYLGVLIDHNLNWCEHIAYIKNKVSKGVGIMYKARQYLDKKSLQNLYYSYIYPYLIYCIEVWGSACQTHLHPLFLTQKKIVRIITFSNYLAHTQPIFIDLSILPLDKLILHRIGIIMYKIFNGMLPVIMNELYIKNRDIHSYNTRSSNLLRVPRGTMNFANISARLWNVLVLNIDVNVSITIFKRNLKTYLLHNSVVLKYSK